MDFERNQLVGKRLRQVKANADLANLARRGGVEGAAPEDYHRGHEEHDLANLRNLLKDSADDGKNLGNVRRGPGGLRAGSSGASLGGNSKAIVGYNRQASTVAANA